MFVCTCILCDHMLFVLLAWILSISIKVLLVWIHQVCYIIATATWSLHYIYIYILLLQWWCWSSHSYCNCILTSSWWLVCVWLSVKQSILHLIVDSTFTHFSNTLAPKKYLFCLLLCNLWIQQYYCLIYKLTSIPMYKESHWVVTVTKIPLGDNSREVLNMFQLLGFKW